MKNAVKLNLVVLLAILGVSFSSVSAYAAKGDKNIEKVRAELVKMIPPAAEAEIVATPAKNVYRLQVQGSYAFAYVDGDHILIGDLYNTKDQANLGELAQSKLTAEKIAAVPTTKMIVYGPKDAKRHITVFTDIDCGYCRKLHRELPEITAAGIQVRYLAFPRAGVGSESHKKYVSVWCNDDQQNALTDAKAGKAVPTASCDNPVTESYQLGQQVGVRGTPTIIFDDGTVTPGYLPHAELIKRLGMDGA